MTVIIWKDEHSINVKEIDEQHKKIVELVNSIHLSIKSSADKSELEEKLSHLIDYTRMHFSTEEQLMQQYDYPEFSRHQREHKILLQHLERVLAVVSSGEYPAFCSDYNVSTDWAVIHILESDKLLGAFLNARNVF